MRLQHTIALCLLLEAAAVVVDLPKQRITPLGGTAQSSTSKRGAACEQLQSWLSEHGGDAAVEVGASRRGGWGLITNRHVRAGEVLARVPRTLACCAAHDVPPYLAATRNRHDLGRLSARGAVAAKVCEAASDEAFADWLEAQPSMADLEALPVLWDDADDLLRGCRKLWRNQSF